MREGDGDGDGDGHSRRTWAGIEGTGGTHTVYRPWRSPWQWDPNAETVYPSI